MNYDKIIQFLDLNRGRKFNILLSIFSSLISGFILIFVINPKYCKEFSPFLIVMLSLSAIAPIYIFNQICSVIAVYKLSKKALTKVASFANLQPDQDKELDNFISEFIRSESFHFIYNPPARQVGELVTVIAVYISALVSWIFSFSLISTYGIITFISCLLLFATLKFLYAVVDELKPNHFEPLLNKLRKDEDFKVHLKKRLDHLESLIKEKKERREQC
jgi:hypothetical protein